VPYNEKVEVDEIGNTGLIRTPCYGIRIPDGGLRCGGFSLLTRGRSCTTKEGFIVVVTINDSSVVTAHSSEEGQKSVNEGGCHIDETASTYVP
jgi:hypothetical protein